MRNTILISLLFLSTLFVNAQENLVPNPSFEEAGTISNTWVKDGNAFTNVMAFWTSPTSNSPDIFTSTAHPNWRFRVMSIGLDEPFAGKNMVGISVYAPKNMTAKEHHREYVHVKLKAPLQKGKTYYAECYVKLLHRGLQINEIGMLFTPVEINIDAPANLISKPQIQADKLDGEWTKISGTITPNRDLAYLTIGNFMADKVIQSTTISKNPLEFAYVYVDDVLVKSINTNTKPALAVGTVFTLDNILFEYNKADLLPIAFEELNKLVKQMKQDKELQVTISGHTDNSGSDNYNQTLSKNRAKAVAAYLKQQGIETIRITYQGFGESQPIADNSTETGRAQNRRVEFLLKTK